MCSTSSQSKDVLTVTDHLSLHKFDAKIFSPASKIELVESVRQSVKAIVGDEAAGKDVIRLQVPTRALGSNYSLSKVGVAEGGSVINTDQLNKHLVAPWGGVNKGFNQNDRVSSLAGMNLFWSLFNNDNYLTKALDGKHYVYVEAGIKIKNLLQDLKNCGLALRTMGAGGGQSLAGAISTSTHGGDFAESEATLGDAIRAIHLINPQGNEVWIAPTSSPFSFSSGNQHISRLFPDLHEVKFINKSGEDTLFRAAQVSLGRFGVIYAYVIEVVPEYSLIEMTQKYAWNTIKTSLANSSFSKSETQTNKTSWTGAFNKPISLDLFKQKRKEMESSTEFSYIDTTDQIIYKTPDPLAYFHGSGTAAGGTLTPLHHLNIVLNLADKDACWVTSRWRFSEVLPPTGDVVAKAQKKKSKLLELLQSGKTGDIDFKDKPLVLLTKAKNELAKAIVEDAKVFSPSAFYSDASVRESVEELLLEIFDHLLKKNRSKGEQVSRLDPKEIWVVQRRIANKLKPFKEMILCLVGWINAELTQNFGSDVAAPAKPRSYTESTKDRLLGFIFILMHRIIRNVKLSGDYLQLMKKNALKPAIKKYQQDLSEISHAISVLSKTEFSSSLKEDDDLKKKVAIVWGLDEADSNGIDAAIKQMRTSSQSQELLNQKIKERVLAYRVLLSIKSLLQRIENSLSGSDGILMLSRAITSFAIEQQLGPSFRAGLATEILDTHNYDLDGLGTGNSAEFFFDAAALDENKVPQYLSFIEAVRKHAGCSLIGNPLVTEPYYFPVIGYIGIRFMPRSKALLAMQRFEQTVSVEVTVLRSELEDVYYSFRQKVCESAAQFGGIPHWGQEFDYTNNNGKRCYDAAKLKSVYSNYLDKHEADQHKDDMKNWIASHQSGDIDPSHRFKTSFSIDCGLEEVVVQAKPRRLRTPGYPVPIKNSSRPSDVKAPPKKPDNLPKWPSKKPSPKGKK